MNWFYCRMKLAHLARPLYVSADTPAEAEQKYFKAVGIVAADSEVLINRAFDYQPTAADLEREKVLQ